MILPTLYGNTYNKRLIAFYVAIYHKRFGEYPKIDYSPLFLVQLKRAFNKYGEIKVAAAILFHFEQNSAKIQEAKFPFHWIFKKIDEYMQKLQDYYEIDIDNEQELYSCIENRLKYLAINFTM